MKSFLDFLEKIFRNWKTKLFFIFTSLLFAFIYHFYILTYKVIDIPLFYEINPSLSLLNEIPNTIPLKVKGREEVLNFISSKDFKAYIDSQGIKEEGFYSLAVIIEPLLRDTQGLQYSSETNRINITLEKTKKALVEVIPSFSGSLGNGLEIEEISLFPKRVIIEGPSSVISLLQQIPIKPVDLSIHQESFSQLVEIDTPFNLKTSNKSLISLSVNIKIIKESIQLDNIPIKFINLSPNLIIDNFEEEGWFYSSFMTKDKELAIESLKNTQLIIDLSSIREEGFFSLPVQILTKAEKQYISYGPHEINLLIKEKKKRGKMIFGIGIDIIENKRFDKWCDNDNFLKKYFNKEELESCEQKGEGKVESLAARFAAKEAFSKALGTGISNFSLKDIIILNNERGKPFIIAKEKALKPLKEYLSYEIFLSLSHEKNYSVAMVVIEVIDKN